MGLTRGLQIPFGRGTLLTLARLQMGYRDRGFRIVCGESAPVDDLYIADNPEDGLVGKTCILRPIRYLVLTYRNNLRTQ